jgi:hypothetical protein
MLVDKLPIHDDPLTRGAGDELVEPMTEAQRAASWDDYEPRRVILGDEMYAPGLRHVQLGGRKP